MKYKVQVWYRYGSYGDEKDYEIYEVEAEAELQAKYKALQMHKIGTPYKTEII